MNGESAQCNGEGHRLALLNPLTLELMRHAGISFTGISEMCFGQVKGRVVSKLGSVCTRCNFNGP